MPRNRGRKASVDVARSERDRGREARKRSHGKHTGRVPNEAAGRRSRDLDTGVDDQSAPTRLLVVSTSGRAQGPERAVRASDRSGSSRVLQTAKVRADRPTSRAEDPDSSDSDSDSSSSDSDSSSSDSDSSASSISLPDPYDGKPDQRVFDGWVFKVKNWASLKKLPRRAVMYLFPRLVTGEAERCFRQYVVPTSFSRKWKPKEVFKLLQEHCFPYDHKVRLYRQLRSAKQGNRKVAAYAEEVEFLAGHLPHVSKKFLAIVFWEGLNYRIREKVVMMDEIELGRIDLQTLIRRALVAERACRIRPVRGLLLCDPDFRLRV